MLIAIGCAFIIFLSFIIFFFGVSEEKTEESEENTKDKEENTNETNFIKKQKFLQYPFMFIKITKKVEKLSEYKEIIRIIKEYREWDGKGVIYLGSNSLKPEVEKQKVEEAEGFHRMYKDTSSSIKLSVYTLGGVYLYKIINLINILEYPSEKINNIFEEGKYYPTIEVPLSDVVLYLGLELKDLQERRDYEGLEELIDNIEYDFGPGVSELIYNIIEKVLVEENKEYAEQEEKKKNFLKKLMNDMKISNIEEIYETIELAEQAQNLKKELENKEIQLRTKLTINS